MKILNTTYDHFLELIKSKDLICYGTGKMLDEMGEIFPRIPCMCRTFTLVDGDRTKQGKERVFLDRTFVVNSLKDAIVDRYNCVVLVTSGMIVEILEDLDVPYMSNTPVFCFSLMRKEHFERKLINVDDCDEILGKNITEQIPRIIHYFWIGGKEMPDDYKKNIETWYKWCPNYDIKLWNESNCNIEENKYAKEAYERGKYGFVPDYFRLKIVYEYGGIYLDTDVELLKPLDELLYLTAYAGFEDNERVALGVGFGATKSFPILREMYEAYENVSFIKSDGSLNTIASPVYQTEILKKHGLRCDGRMQLVDNMTILPMNYLTVQSNHTGRRYLTKNSFSIHKYSASWFDEKDRANKQKAEELLSSVQFI